MSLIESLDLRKPEVIQQMNKKLLRDNYLKIIDFVVNKYNLPQVKEFHVFYEDNKNHIYYDQESTTYGQINVEYFPNLHALLCNWLVVYSQRIYQDSSYLWLACLYENLAHELAHLYLYNEDFYKHHKEPHAKDHHDVTLKLLKEIKQFCKKSNISLDNLESIVK